MKIFAAIPSYNRQDKLIKCIESIERNKEHLGEHKLILGLYFNTTQEVEFFEELYGKTDWVYPFFINEEHRAPDLWNSILTKNQSDLVCYLSDDLELEPHCMINAIDCMNNMFPDLDGVVGLSITNFPENRVVQASFGLIGTKFADRFPDRHVFCPEYSKFCIDKELEIYAKSINRFHYCTAARLYHHHPAHSKSAPDETHIHVRKHLLIDMQMRTKRQEKGYLWGKNFELIGVA